MEFMEYLDRTAVEIIKIIEQAGYKTEENTKLCLLGDDYVGFLDKRKKIISICTNNAKKRELFTLLRNNDKYNYERIGLHIKKAVRHEAVHVAQECNNGNLLKIKEKLSMRTSKMRALNGSINISGEVEKEKEAYILEDKPKEVKQALIKYCL